jgi:hypothetical protein
MASEIKYRPPMVVATDLVRQKGRHHALHAEACHCIQRLVAERDVWKRAAGGLFSALERLADEGPLVADDVLPVLDRLPQLWAEGFKTRPSAGRWVLVAPDGVAVCSGDSFRALCVNIVLAGL